MVFPPNNTSHSTKELIYMLLTFPWKLGNQLWSYNFVKPERDASVTHLQLTFVLLIASGSPVWGLTLFSFFEPGGSLKIIE